MAEIVNLRQARKRKTRADRERAADINRLSFGRPNSERQATKLEKSRASKALDAQRRDEPTQ